MDMIEGALIGYLLSIPLVTYAFARYARDGVQAPIIGLLWPVFLILASIIYPIQLLMDGLIFIADCGLRSAKRRS